MFKNELPKVFEEIQLFKYEHNFMITVIDIFDPVQLLVARKKVSDNYKLQTYIAFVKSRSLYLSKYDGICFETHKLFKKRLLNVRKSTISNSKIRPLLLISNDKVNNASNKGIYHKGLISS